MKILRAIYSWSRNFCTTTDLYYHSLGRLYFVLRWAIFLAVLILFTGAWYDDFFKECKNGCFSGFTVGMIVLSGIVAYCDAREKIIEGMRKDMR